MDRLRDFRRVVLSGLCLLGTVNVNVALAAEIEVRFVAGDRRDRPLVSSLADFRRSPDGGLIAVEWVSGVLIDGEAAFPVETTDPALQQDPNPALSSKPDPDGLGDILDDIKKSKAEKPENRPVDVVDEQYRKHAFSDGRRAGPVRRRRSAARLDLLKNALLTPGNVALQSAVPRVEVPCFPLTITAVRAGESATFTPRLTFADRDLLADCLFEHSPDMPLGDESPESRQGAQGQLGWLNGTRGGMRPFRQLTLYLPANAASKSDPYRLNGQSFRMTPQGVVLEAAPAASKPQVRQAAPFHVELVLAAEPAPATLAVVAELGGDWQVEPQTVAVAPDNLTTGEIRLRSAKDGARILRPRLPTTPGGSNPKLEHRHLRIVRDSAETAQPVARIVAIPAASATRDGRLTVRIAQVDEKGPISLPARFTGELVVLPDFRGPSTGSGPTPAAEEVHDRPTLTLNFERTTADTWTASLSKVDAGLHGLRLNIVPAGRELLPVVVMGQKTTAAASLCTYHNRCDYRRGEQVPVCVQTRVLADLTDRPVVLIVEQGGESFPIAKLELSCPKGQSQTLFVPIDTSRFGLGTWTVSLRDGNQTNAKPKDLLLYDTRFTLHSDAPATTFALHAWMTGSFSGPLKTGAKPLVNLVVGQKPSGFLTPDELQRLTSQPAYPAAWRNSLEDDPLYPAPHTVTRYDAETEREAAIAMRLGMQYCPDYGWGMNSQEAAWNPKHTLADELDRIRRLCSQVTQRHRDFGNFGGLHLNWYPRLGGNWENHPPTDGNAAPRQAQLESEAAEIYAETDDDKTHADSGLIRGVRAHTYRVGALARAYARWTEQARTLTPGQHPAPQPDPVQSAFPPDQQQPGLTGAPVYTSFVPVSWFSQRNYYPSAYHAGLPVAAVHAYTDYGFSPFQHLWALDHWAGGLGEQPRWVTTMSNGRDVMLHQALLLAGRGADGIDLNGQDPQASAVIADFLSAYGPFFRTLQPHSEVAIVTSLRQQFSTESLVGQWMGYTGGSYFDLYTKLWYARRPPAMLPEEDITPERLRQYRAVFLVGQQVPLPGNALATLQDYVASGGHVFKDTATAESFPGQRYDLGPPARPVDQAAAWDPEKYQATRDRAFVATQAGYEASAATLNELLKQLPPPRVDSPTHDTLLATLEPLSTQAARAAGSKSAEAAPRIASVVFAANDRRAMPGINHPWNFWSATIMGNRSRLHFDEPYVLYDLLAGGREIALERQEEGRYVLPVEFDRCAGRSYIAATSPIRHVQVRTSAKTGSGPLAIEADILDDRSRVFSTPFPCEIAVMDATGKTVQTIHRALGGTRRAWITLPVSEQPADWQLRVRELASGRTAIATVSVTAAPVALVEASPVLIPRRSEVAEFLKAAIPPAHSEAAEAAPLWILLDSRQIADVPALRELAERLQTALTDRGRPAEVRVVDALDVIELPLRWRPTSRDQQYLSQVATGERIVMASSLRSINERLRDGSSGALDVLHPDCGWLEPGARHRIQRDVILLGNSARNRFLADLEETGGLRSEADFLAGGAALVQRVYAAFTPRHDCLTIQGDDLAALGRGVDALLALPVGTAAKNADSKPREPAQAAGPDKAARQTVTGAELLALPNPIREVFGATVHPLAFGADGSLLVWADTQADCYFRFGPDGKLDKKWLGKYAVELDSRTTQGSGENADPGMWIREWWGVPGFVDAIVRADNDARPQWLMQLPRYARSFQGWQHPGRRALVDPAGRDLFVSGNGSVSRIRPDGTLVWQYDDLQTAYDVESFRFSRDLMLHGASADGRHLLVAAFGIEPYGNFASRFVRPAVLLLEAQTGKIVWQKPDLLINHSACGFVAADRIVIADATPGRKRVMLLDLAGREVWSRSRPEGTSEARLSADGRWLVVRPEAPRDANLQVLGPPQGLSAVPVDDQQAPPRQFALSDAVHAWRMTQAEGRVLVSTTDGRLRCFAPDTALLWEQQFHGACNLLDAPDGRQIAVGTQNGLLLLLDGDGKLLRETDLMPHNIVTDEAQYVRDYSASPAGVPTRDPRPESASRVDQRSGKGVRFSPNLLSGSDVKQLAASSRKADATLRIASAQPGTYLLSLTQRTAGGRQSSGVQRLRVEVRRGGSSDLLYTAAVALSAAWEERTFAWKLAQPGPLALTIRYEGEGDGFELRDPGLFLLTFPSRNVLAQRLPDAPDVKISEPAETGLALLDDDEHVAPPAVRFFLPNDLDLAARARGAPAFRPVVPFTAPFDGKVSGQNSSWLGKPLSGSSHAQLQLTFKSPVTLTTIALYESPDADYTGIFALFCRDAKTKQWRKVGHASHNASPFNLYTFDPISTDAVTYYWGGSPDGHARLTEFEAYHPSTLLAPRETDPLSN